MTTITIERGLVLKLYLYWLEDISPDRLEAFRDKLRAVLGVPVTALEQLDPADLCDVCGEPVRYGSRHHACGDSVLRANATSSPATAPEQCWCQTCRPITQADNRMVLCPDCGNKRCPKATDHRNACTGSNEPGQPGSSYPTVPATAPATAPEKTVKEIMGFVRHYAANTFSSATLEDKIRRSLATPATAPAQPVWHDAPTVPGLWMGWHNHVHQIEAGDLRKFSLNSGLRWYGPIPEDK